MLTRHFLRRSRGPGGGHFVRGGRCGGGTPPDVLSRAVLSRAVLPQAAPPRAVLLRVVLPRTALPQAVLPQAVLRGDAAGCAADARRQVGGQGSHAGQAVG